MHRLLARLPSADRRRVQYVGCGAPFEERPRNCHACGGQEFSRNR